MSRIISLLCALVLCGQAYAQILLLGVEPSNTTAGNLAASPTTMWDTSGQKFGTAALSGGYGWTPNFPSSLSWAVSTISLWFKKTGTPAATSYIVSLDNGTAGTVSIQMLTNGTLQVQYFSGGAAVAKSTGATNYADGAWHQAEMDLSGAGMIIFIDGVSKNTAANVPDASQGANFAIGARARVFNNGWAGETDEVSIWSTNLHTVGFTPPAAPWVGNEANLFKLWHLDSNYLNSGP